MTTTPASASSPLAKLEQQAAAPKPAAQAPAAPQRPHGLWETRSESIKAISAALAKAQGIIGHASKDATNPHFRSKYADLSMVISAAKEALAANGLSVIQRPAPSSTGVFLQTVILHESGEHIADGGLFIPAAKNDAQAMGSALTYARRYALAAMLGIAQADDDGNAATR